MQEPANPKNAQRLPSGWAHGLTDVGAVRTSNEDGFLIDAKLGLLIVADGMGGHANGKMASDLALTQMHAAIIAQMDAVNASNQALAVADPDATNPDVLPFAMTAVSEAIKGANQAIFAVNANNAIPEGHGMGTTITGIWHPDKDGPAFVFNVGDSRVYRFRAGLLEQMTQDDTLFQQMLNAGLSDPLPSRNMLLKAVGPNVQIEPIVLQYAANAQDLYLVCSDGLHGELPDHEIADILRQVHTSELEQVCANLVSAAIAAGSRDNVTAVLLVLDR